MWKFDKLCEKQRTSDKLGLNSQKCFNRLKISKLKGGFFQNSGFKPGARDEYQGVR